MATTHLKDILAVTGTYTDRNGEERKRYKNVGKLLRNGNGEFLVFDRTFNPAGLPGEGDVFLSLFDPKPRESQGGQQGTAHPNSGAGGYQAPAAADLEDEIPF